MTSIIAAVWFWITTGILNMSPKLRNLGKEGRTINGRRTVRLDSPIPNFFQSGSTAATMIRYRVRLSGTCTGILAVPSKPVRTEGANAASGLKSVLTSIVLSSSPPSNIFSSFPDANIGIMAISPPPPPRPPINRSMLFC